MSRLSEIQAAWDAFEQSLGDADLAKLVGALPQGDYGPASPVSLLHYFVEILRGTLAYTPREGWFGPLTINGEQTTFCVGVLMEEGRPVGVRQIARDAFGRKVFSGWGPVFEDVYGHVGGWLTQDGRAFARWRETSELPKSIVRFDQEEES